MVRADTPDPDLTNNTDEAKATIEAVSSTGTDQESSGEPPVADGPLARTGGPFGALALGGLAVLLAGIAVVSTRRRLVPLPVRRRD